MALLRRCGAALADVLRGRAQGLDLLFGGEPSAGDLYRESPVAQAMNRGVAAAVAAAVTGLPEGRRLRVLEVGAGTGGVTGAVLAAVPAGRTDYAYTDISAGFFREAEERFAGAAGVRLEFRTLDIERDPGEQGFDDHAADVVLAANVLHATRDLGEALGHCRRLLAPRGLLIALEATVPAGWLDLTFGLLPGWWRFEDAYRTGHALIAPPVWRRALADAGYEEAEVLETGADPGTGAPGVILARAPAETRPRPGLFVVWPAAAAQAGDGSLALVRELETAGQQVLVPSGVAASRRQSWREFFAALPSEPPLRGVAHLGAVADPAPETVDAGFPAEVEGVASSALALVQGLQDAGAAPAAGVWFVTRGGQGLEAERGGGLAGSLLWGFGRTAAHELGGVPVRLLDLDPHEAGWARVLAGELLYPDRETEVACRGGSRRVPRLVPSRRAAVDGRAAPVREDRSYLVTGGLGGIGLAVADWLLGEGAGAVVLNGRRPPDPAAAEAVARLRDRGREARVALADVTDREAVSRLVAEIGPEADLPPLGGVVHSAGLLSDASLTNQDWAGFARVLGPKVLGGWYLHGATRSLELDFFVLFSSFTGLLGSPGQANHAAANAFLDRLALHRRSLGLPGQAIQWGAWSGVGEAEEQRGRIERRLAAAGVDWITPERGLRAFARLLREDVPGSAVMSVDWSAYGDGSVRIPALLSELAASGGSAAAGLGADLLARLREAPADRRELLVLDFLREEVRSLLRLGEHPAPQTGFFDLGMDSLMAVELRNRVNRTFAGAVEVPASVVFDFPSPTRLARRLVELLALGGDGAAGDAAGGPDRAPPAAEESLDDLLAEIRAEVGHEDA